MGQAIAIASAWFWLVFPGRTNWFVTGIGFALYKIMTFQIKNIQCETSLRRNGLFMLLICVILALNVASSYLGNFSTEKWSFEQRGPILAIGDIHADPYAFLDILIRAKVLDQSGQFIAHKQGRYGHISLLGDLTDKGPYTRGVWDIVLFLEREAAKHGIDVLIHVGNHDKMIQLENFVRMEAVDLEYFQDFSRPGDSRDQAVVRAILREPYRSLMQRMRVMSRIGRYFFVHASFGSPDYFMSFVKKNGVAGVNRVYTQFVIDRHNYMQKKLSGNNSSLPAVHPLLRYWDFKSPQGPEGLPNTPLWSRDLRLAKMDAASLREIMDYLKVDLVVHGHTVTENREPTFQYGGATLDLDTNISASFAKKDSKASLSAAILHSNGDVELLSSITDKHFKRGQNPKSYHWLRTELSPSLRHCQALFLY